MRWSCRQNCGDTTTICVMTVVTVMNTYCRHCIVAGIVLCAPDAPDSMESWFMAVLHLKLARGSDGSASGSTRTATNVGGSDLTVITVDDACTIGVAHKTHSITCSQLGSQRSLSVSPSMRECWHGTPWHPTAWWIRAPAGSEAAFMCCWMNATGLSGAVSADATLLCSSVCGSLQKQNAVSMPPSMGGCWCGGTYHPGAWWLSGSTRTASDHACVEGHAPKMTSTKDTCAAGDASSTHTTFTDKQPRNSDRLTACFACFIYIFLCVWLMYNECGAPCYGLVSEHSTHGSRSYL